MVSVQVLNEFVATARRKLAMSWDETSEATSYGFHFYDALVVASALAADCETLLYSKVRLSFEKRDAMQVAKWGNSLAVRLPAAVVEALELKEGDQIEIRIADERTFEVRRDRSRQEALRMLRKLRRPLPPGFVFDRDEANAR